MWATRWWITLRNQWHPVKVDIVNIHSLCDASNDQFKDNACTKTGKSMKSP
jgi:hypothetical protein